MTTETVALRRESCAGYAPTDAEVAALRDLAAVYAEHNAEPYVGLATMLYALHVRRGGE